MANNPNAGEIVRVRVSRSDPDARREFEVPSPGPLTVLDLLHIIQRDLDPSFSFRYSCRVSRCGTCTVQVNKRPVLACQTRVGENWQSVLIEPLSGLPVVKDLIVDMAPFLEQWKQVTPYLVPKDASVQPASIAVDAPERKIIDPARSCISCGACYSGCGMTGAEREFLGPAALIRAMTLIADSRDASEAQRLQKVSKRGGVDGCHYQGVCTDVCPQGLDPAGAIRQLRRWRLMGKR